MTAVLSALLPGVLAVVGCAALVKRVDLFSSLIGGAKEGINVSLGILPTLVILFTAIYMLRASGALDMLCDLLSPVATAVGIPAECLPLALIRPFSGSGALALGADIIREAGADSLVGRTAAVMLGSTETTFYVIAVYFGGAGVTKSRHALPAALVADAVGFCAAAMFCRLFFG